MEKWAYQKSLQFTKGLQEHSSTWMEMMEKRKRGRSIYEVLKENNVKHILDSHNKMITEETM